MLKKSRQLRAQNTLSNQLQQMSLPTSSLSKLTISGMPPTSSTSTRHSHTKNEPVTSSDDYSGSEEDSGDDSDTSTSRTFFTSPNTKLHYDASRLSPTTSINVRRGFRAHLAFTGCSHYDEESSGEYFGVQLSETVGVRVGAPGTKYAALKCSCDESTTKPCRHIFFLQDQLAKDTFTEQQKRRTLPLTDDGLPHDMLNAFQKLKYAGPNLVHKLRGTSATESDDEDEEQLQGNNPMGLERCIAVRDILASFSETGTRDDYLPDIFNNSASQTATENQLYPKNLEKTLAASMMINDEVFNHFRSIVRPSHCSSDYFQKKCRNALSALEDMDDYTQTKRYAQGGPPPDVPWCAGVVAGLVDDIVARVNEPNTTSLPRSAKERAAQALCQILKALCEHNEDVHDKPVWQNTQQQALDIRDRNIFVRFFKDPPRSGDKKFILDDLSLLGDAATNYLEMLKDMTETFNESQVSRIYGERLQSLIKELRGKGRASCKSVTKRPGDESGGDTKRMK